jgi:hypothetical protein
MGVHVSVSQELVKDWLDKMADRLEKQMDEMGGLLDSEVAQRRLDRLSAHLCNSSIVKEEQLSRELCAKLIKRPLNPSVLANLMAGMSSDRLCDFSGLITVVLISFAAIDFLSFSVLSLTDIAHPISTILMPLRCRLEYLYPRRQCRVGAKTGGLDCDYRAAKSSD